MRMIVLDIETSGLTHDCGIWQIGAIDLKNPENYFFEEARIDSQDTIQEGALKVTGKTRDFFLDSNKQSQENLIKNYLNWCEKQNERFFFGQNVGWDISFIQAKIIKYGIYDLFERIHGHRGQNIEVIVQEKYYDLNGTYLLDENKKNAMNLSKVLDFCGIKDERVNVRGVKGIVEKEGTPHNALTDCKLEGECFSRLKFGKNLFPEYKEFEIPDYLRK